MDEKTAWQNAWSSTNALNTGMGLLQGVTGIAGAVGKNYQIKDTESLDEQIDALRNTEFGYGDFDSLQSAYNPVTIDKVTGDDLRSSDGERFTNTLSAVGSGLSAGAAFGPVGMAIGAGVGLLGSIGGMWAGNAKAGKEASRLNKEAEAAQKEYLANFSNNAQNIAQSNFNRAALNLAAFGGMLKDNNINSFLKSRVRLAAFGGDMMSAMGRTDGFSNGVTKVDEGGSHETNPFDGVMMGVDPQGVPNLVEEGEVIFNDYVFSNRLAPTEEELESVKLPRKYAKKPYSKIAWDIQKESQENPLDKISKNTLVDSMMKLTTLQEQSREKDREYETFSNLESVFADGGDIHIAPSKRGTFTAAAKRRGLGVQEFASKVLSNKDKYSPAMVRKANFAHNSAGWKHGFGGNLFYNGEYVRRAAPIGSPDGTYIPELTRPEINWDSYYTPVEDEVIEETIPGYSHFVNNLPKKQEQNNIPEFKNSAANTWMRAIPVIGSSINAMADAFGWRNKEDYSALDLIKQRENQIRNVKTSPIGRYMAFNPYDVDYEMNRLQNVGLGTQRALLDSAGGNPLAARNAALALNANLTSQMGAARRAGAQYNDELGRAVTQFNSGIDQFNANQALHAGVYNQRGDVERMEGAIRRAALMDAIQTATSQARSTEETAALNNWGQWGNDRTFADMAAWYQRYIAPYNDATRAYGQATAAKGGKIKRIKEFKKK